MPPPKNPASSLGLLFIVSGIRSGRDILARRHTLLSFSSTVHSLVTLQIRSTMLELGVTTTFS